MYLIYIVACVCGQMIVLHVRGGKGRGGGRIRNKVKGNQILLTYSIGSLSRTNAGGAAHCAGAQAYPQHHFTVGNSQGGGARGGGVVKGIPFCSVIRLTEQN